MSSPSNPLDTAGRARLSQRAAGVSASSGGALGTGTPYRPGREIARGGMGAVLDTQDDKFQRAVAMKVMLRGANEEGRRRFLQEARVLGQLAHPNIVPVHDLGVDEQGRLFYTMKLVKGVTLRAVLDALRAGDRETVAKYPLGQLLTVFQKVCDAMAFAHARGVIHRDLKPDNIMVGEFGEVLVMDWGLAKILPDSQASSALVVTDAVAPAKPEPVVDPSAETVAWVPPGSRRGDEADGDASTKNPPPHVGTHGPEDATLPLIAPRPTPSSAPAHGSRRREEADGVASTGNPPPHVGGYGAHAPGPGALPPTATPTPLSATNTSSATLEGSVMGTPHFMAPEQARGAVNEIDARSDVFALGGVLYMILTLEKPVAGKDVSEVLANVLAGRITPPVRQQSGPLPHCPDGRVPEALSAVAMKALQVEPARRYHSVAYLQADLAAYQNGFATSAEEAGVLKQLQLLILRHKIIAAATLLALLLSAGFMAKVMASERRAVFNQQRAATKQAEAVASQKNTAATLVRLRDTAPTFHEQALARLKDQQLEPALEKIAYAIELMPAEPGYRLLQANLLQTLLRLAEAKAAYTNALQLDPTNTVARENLALCDQLTLSTNGGGLEARSLTNLLATLRRQQRLDEALYLTSQGGGGDKQLLQTWLARLTAAGVKFASKSLHAFADGTLQLSLERPTNKDLAVLKGMPLRKLSISDARAVRSLAPVAGMPLEELYLARADMDSIEPLRGMRLHTLTLRDCRVADLRPLAGMALTDLSLYMCKNVQDISPLAGQPIHQLDISRTGVKNVTPLKGMPLEELKLAEGTTNLAPLAGMPLQQLNASILHVPDLKPLAGLPLRRLTLTGAATHDLSPLRACRQLEELVFNGQATDWNVLLDIPSLKTVTRSYPRKPLPPAQFIAEQTRPAKK